VEISRRRFLGGSVALCVMGGISTQINTGKAIALEKRGQRYRVATLCEMCVNKCAVYAYVEDGVVVKLDPNPLFPKSRNMLCPRGVAGTKHLYDPDRLKYPMIRDGEKGSGKFRRVTWEEAHDYIAERLVKILDEEEDNRSTVAFAAGEGMGEHTFKQFYDGFGSAHFLNHSTLCLATATSGHALTIGNIGQADLQNAKYVIMAGANRAEAIITPDTMDLFKKTQGNGCKLIVVDPRFTNTAAKSDKYLGINVGTDLAFVLALTHVALKENLYHKTYVDSMFNGFDEYKAHILSNGYTPEWAEKITGIPAKEIYEVARDFMKHAPQAIYYQGRRSTWSANDFQLRRAQALFTALGGGIDVKGGICFGKGLPLKSSAGIAPLYDQARPRIERAAAAAVGNTGAWVPFRNMVLEDKAPYPVRALFLYKHNPMHNMPDIKKTTEFLKKLELVVTIETMPTDTVLLSDVVLPECTYLERTDPVKVFPGIEPAIAQRNKVIDPIHPETKPVIDIMQGLAEKLSPLLFEVTKKYDESVREMIADGDEEAVYKEYNLALPFQKTQEALNAEAVEAYPDAAEILKEKGVYYPHMEAYFKQLSANEFQYYPEDKKYYSVLNGKLQTPSGKVECVLSDALAKKGIDAMPTWRKEYEMEIPEGKFRFITGRHAQNTQTSTANNALLLNLLPVNYAWINKRIAGRMGIKHGDRVELISSIGKAQLPAYPTEKIGPQTIFFVHGYGIQSDQMKLAQGNGASSATIVEDKVEPMHGATCLHDTLIEVRKV